MPEETNHSMNQILPHLGIPHHDAPISGAGVYEAVAPPFDAGDGSGVAGQREDTPSRVGVPHFGRAVLGRRHKAPTRHLYVRWLPRHGHDAL